jgi:hypothetical protein
MIDPLRKNHPRLPVAVRVLLPVDEVVSGLDLQRIIRHRSARMRRRAEPDNLRSELNGAAVIIAGEVMECCTDHARIRGAKMLQCNREIPFVALSP